jgi:hypothetical protein
MARIHPEGWRELRASGALARQVETLQYLADALPDHYSVFHGVHWARVEHAETPFGEIDFAIVAPDGALLLVEQKSGLLEETGEGLVKRHARGEKRVAVRLARARDALVARLGQDTPRVDILLYCPDYAVRDPGSAGLDPSRIVDAKQRERLARIVHELLPDAHIDAPRAARMQRFLADELRLAPDVGALIGESCVLYTRLSGGLAHWARRIEHAPFRLRVVGTAGSGKTQLALCVLADAIAAGRRPLYVCYNRPLADHIARLTPEACVVVTYHQLCDRLQRAAGHVPDFSRPDAFAALEGFMATYIAPESWRFDELIVDEGQDFQPEWLPPLLRLLRPDGRAWWLEDPMQNLYGRRPVQTPDWITLRADTNYRSPRDILERINRLIEGGIGVGSPISESGVEVLTYGSPAELMERTKTAITRGLGAGFRKESMVLLTFRGREHSQFTQISRLGPHALRAFTGAYDLLGAPVYSAGDLLLESVYRFKGQSAPCVIFTEIDFERLDDMTTRKLFVGMTRAGLKLVLVLSERARSALDTVLEA